METIFDENDEDIQKLFNNDNKVDLSANGNSTEDSRDNTLEDDNHFGNSDPKQSVVANQTDEKQNPAKNHEDTNLKPVTQISDSFKNTTDERDDLEKEPILYSNNDIIDENGSNLNVTKNADHNKKDLLEHIFAVNITETSHNNSSKSDHEKEFVKANEASKNESISVLLTNKEDLDENEKSSENDSKTEIERPIVHKIENITISLEKDKSFDQEINNDNRNEQLSVNSMNENENFENEQPVNFTDGNLSTSENDDKNNFASKNTVSVTSESDLLAPGSVNTMEDSQETDDYQEKDDSQETEESQKTADSQVTDYLQETDHSQETDDSQETEESQKLADSQVTDYLQETDDYQEKNDSQETDNSQETDDYQEKDDSQETGDSQKTENSQVINDSQETADSQEGEDSQDADSSQEADDLQETHDLQEINDSVVKTAETDNKTHNSNNRDKKNPALNASNQIDNTNNDTEKLILNTHDNIQENDALETNDQELEKLMSDDITEAEDYGKLSPAKEDFNQDTHEDFEDEKNTNVNENKTTIDESKDINQKVKIENLSEVHSENPINKNEDVNDQRHNDGKHFVSLENNSDTNATNPTFKVNEDPENPIVNYDDYDHKIEDNEENSSEVEKQHNDNNTAEENFKIEDVLMDNGKKSHLPENKTTVNEIEDVKRKDEVEIVSDKDLMDMVNTNGNLDEHTETEQKNYLEKDFQNSNDKKSSGSQNYDETELDSPEKKDYEQENKIDIKTEEEILTLQKLYPGDNTNDVLPNNSSHKPTVNNDEKYHTTQNENDSEPVYENFEENDPGFSINENINETNQKDKLFSNKNEEVSINVHTNETETSHQNFNKTPNSSSVELEKSREDENDKAYDNINVEKVQNDISDDNIKSNNITSDEGKAASLISDVFDYLASKLSGVTKVPEEEISEAFEHEKISDSNIKNDSVKINESNSSTKASIILPLEDSISDDSPELPDKSSVLKPFDPL